MFNFFRKHKTIHLDFASTTPVAPEVLRRMLPYFSEEWANPNAIYASGVRARRVIDESRVTLARLLRIRPQGVIFTSGGTESNNQAIVGTVEALRESGRAYTEMEIVTTRIEHPSILETCTMLEKRGVAITYLAVGEDGRIQEKELASALNQKTVLVTFAYVNSEVGVIQDVKRITRIVRAFNAEQGTHVLVHLDAAQAPLWLPCELDMLGVDMMTLDVGKCYGPKGVGVLALRHGVNLQPLMHGGGQERGLRSGTENVPLIVGCVNALVRAEEGRKSRSEAVASLRDFLRETILREVQGAIINGSLTNRVANNVHISIPGIDAEYAVITLDAHGVSVSTKSACGSSSSQGSYVVREMTQDEARATSTIRFTLGETTTKKELLYAVRILKEHVEKTRTFINALPKPIV